MKIFLIGFMGSGKTTLAKKLALRMGYDLIDLDHELEKVLNTTIADFFKEHGEQAFRELESKTLKKFAYPENCVVATGGGAPCYFDNMDWMNSHGKTVYLQLSTPALAQRLYHGRAKRPLLKDLSEEEIENFIDQKMLERQSFYNKAQMKVDGFDLTADTLHALLIAGA
jgi:shikimate kinase